MNLILLGTLWRHISVRRRRQLVWLLVLMLIASFAEVVSIGAVLPFLSSLMAPERVFGAPLVKPFVDWLSLTEPSQLAFPLTVIFIVASIFSGAVRIALLWAQTRLGYAIGTDISIDIYRKTLYQPFGVHIIRNSSDVIASISTKTNIVVQHVILPFLLILSSILIFVTILGTLIAVDPVIALASCVGFGSIYGIIIYGTRKIIERDSIKISRESNQVIKALQEGLGGIRDVLIDGTQNLYCKIYRDAETPLRRSQANIQIISSGPRYVLESLGMVAIAIVAYKLNTPGHGIATAIPLLGALAIGAQRLLPILQHIYSSWSVMRGGKESLSDVLSFLNQSLPEHVDERFVEPLSFQSSIKIENLNFKYAGMDHFVLKDVNIEINKGMRVGFIGATGSGKSTLLDLLMGLLEPTEGNLKVDDIVICKKNNRSWQRRIAHVPQSIFLADTSIGENIAFGVPSKEIDWVRVRYAAERAQLDSTIQNMSRKYDTHVGERGVRLSGGQRQRIGIARAFYKNADVIVLDEATSALDNDTESGVMRNIEMIGKEATILIVAHRLSTLECCDVIYELDHGKIKSSIGHGNVVAKKTAHQSKKNTHNFQEI